MRKNQKILGLITATTLLFGAANVADASRQPRSSAIRNWQAISELVEAWQRWITAVTQTPYTGSECEGRWAIPTSIVWRESRCQPTARNPHSTAGGAYQMIASSRDWALRASGNEEWVGTPAEYLPLRVQHSAAAALWRNSPCHWAPNPWCN